MTERLDGYAALGVGFESGHLLAFRQITKSSIGPPFVTVWHRRPDGTWALYTNVEPRRSCARYLGAAVDRTVVTEVAVTWTGPAELSVSAPVIRLNWSLRLATTPAAALLASSWALLPPTLRSSARGLRPLSRAAGTLLDTAPPALVGEAPSGQRFIVVPRRFWRVAGSAAVIEGHDAGPPGRPGGRDTATSPPPRLGVIPVPPNGAFLAAETRYEAHDPGRHLATTGRTRVVRG